MDDSEDAEIEEKDQSVVGIPLARRIDILADLHEADPQFNAMSLGDVVEHHLKQENL